MITREDFDTIIREQRSMVGVSWGSTIDKNPAFPVISSKSLGRCRYCGKRTMSMYVTIMKKDNAILDVIGRLMKFSNHICNLDCLYKFIVDRTPEIIEEITR